MTNFQFVCRAIQFLASFLLALLNWVDIRLDLTFHDVEQEASDSRNINIAKHLPLRSACIPLRYTFRSEHNTFSGKIMEPTPTIGLAAPQPKLFNPLL